MEKKKSKKPTQKEFEKKVVELAKTGLTSEKIGENLKKKGIHSQDFDKKISEILKEKEIYIDPDLKNVEEKLKKIEKHVENNKQDKKAIRERSRVFSQLRKLKKYNNLI